MGDFGWGAAVSKWGCHFIQPGQYLLDAGEVVTGFWSCKVL